MRNIVFIQIGMLNGIIIDKLARHCTLRIVLQRRTENAISVSYIMVCVSVREDNLRALANGLSSI